MRLETYAVIMVFLAFALYLTGFQSPGSSALDKLCKQQAYGLYGNGQNQSAISYDSGQTSVQCNFFDPGNIVSAAINSLLNPNQIVQNFVAAAAVGAIVALSGFGALYIFAGILLTLFLNVFVFPTSYILTPGVMGLLGSPFDLFITIIFNMIWCFAVLSFIRGGN